MLLAKFRHRFTRNIPERPPLALHHRLGENRCIESYCPHPLSLTGHGSIYGVAIFSEKPSEARALA